MLWTLDFQFDQTSDGRNLKLLNAMDEFTREAMATETERNIDAQKVTEILDRIVALRGSSSSGPTYVFLGPLLVKLRWRSTRHEAGRIGVEVAVVLGRTNVPLPCGSGSVVSYLGFRWWRRIFSTWWEALRCVPSAAGHS